MTGASSLSTLVSWLSREVVQRHTQKRLTGEYDVRVYPLLFGSEWLFAKGALLGRALSDRLEIFMKMFCKAGDERGACKDLRHAAADRLKMYGKDPDSLRDFWRKTELPELDSIPFSDTKLVKRLSRQKCRLDEMIPRLDWWMFSGIGFGAAYPELTERMWRREYETPPDLDPHERELREWVEARGLFQPWEPAPLEPIEHELLVTVAYFAGEYFPELVEPLGLVKELEEGRKDVERQKGSGG